MKYPQALEEGIFLKRYKRFFADIEWQGQIITAHVANTGSMKGANEPGRPCLFSRNEDPTRKLKYSLQMIQAASGAWVGINTALPNLIVKERLQATVGQKGPMVFSHWSEFHEVKPEYKISAESRLDFGLSVKNSDKRHFIEVKNVTLAENGVAQFPDSVTERGQKHLRDLMRLMDEGHTAEIVFTIQRNDCHTFSPADSIDPVYGELLREAAGRGLKISPFVVDLSPHEVNLSETKLVLKL